jgi:hypothetical protein
MVSGGKLAIVGAVVLAVISGCLSFSFVWVIVRHQDKPRPLLDLGAKHFLPQNGSANQQCPSRTGTPTVPGGHIQNRIEKNMRLARAIDNSSFMTNIFHRAKPRDQITRNTKQAHILGTNLPTVAIKNERVAKGRRCAPDTPPICHTSR